MIYKEISSTGELYVYMNGSLLYKKWPSGTSVLFEKYGPPTWSSDRDNKEMK
jgi:hypothetical protein